MKIFTQDEIGKLEAATRVDAVYAIMIQLIVRMGLRQSEAHNLCANDYDDESYRLRIGGQNERVVMVPEQLRLPLARLINGRDEDGYIISTCARGSRRLGERTFQAYLNRIAAQHDMPGLNVNGLRATGIVRYLEAGLDPRLIQKYMGVRTLKSILKYKALTQPSLVGVLSLEPANQFGPVAVGV